MFKDLKLTLDLSPHLPEFFEQGPIGSCIVRFKVREFQG